MGRGGGRGGGDAGGPCPRPPRGAHSLRLLLLPRLMLPLQGLVLVLLPYCKGWCQGCWEGHLVQLADQAVPGIWLPLAQQIGHLHLLLLLPTMLVVVVVVLLRRRRRRRRRRLLPGMLLVVVVVVVVVLLLRLLPSRLPVLRLQLRLLRLLLLCLLRMLLHEAQPVAGASGERAVAARAALQLLLWHLALRLRPGCPWLRWKRSKQRQVVGRASCHGGAQQVISASRRQRLHCPGALGVEGRAALAVPAGKRGIGATCGVSAWLGEQATVPMLRGGIQLRRREPGLACKKCAPTPQHPPPPPPRTHTQTPYHHHHHPHTHTWLAQQEPALAPGSRLGLGSSWQPGGRPAAAAAAHTAHTAATPALDPGRLPERLRPATREQAGPILGCCSVLAGGPGPTDRARQRQAAGLGGLTTQAPPPSPATPADCVHLLGGTPGQGRLIGRQRAGAAARPVAAEAAAAVAAAATGAARPCCLLRGRSRLQSSTPRGRAHRLPVALLALPRQLAATRAGAQPGASPRCHRRRHRRRCGLPLAGSTAAAPAVVTGRAGTRRCRARCRRTACQPEMRVSWSGEAARTAPVVAI